MNLLNKMEIDIFDLMNQEERFVGSAFALTYDKLSLLTNDADKKKVNGIPHSSFLLAFYFNNATGENKEALLLRVLSPIKIPTDNEMVSTMIEYYKEKIDTAEQSIEMDDFTRFDMSFAGLECRILGTFYRDGKTDNLCFGSDVENFYSPNNYKVYKPTSEVLGKIVNFYDGTEGDTVRIGKVRFSSSMRYQSEEEPVEVRIDPLDLVGKRTALFGMTRTGKSNTVKKIIEETVSVNHKIEQNNAYIINNLGNKKVGQIIFDINGEYANKNQQDDASIFEKFSSEVVRYSVVSKDGFKEMKINFYQDVLTGFEYVKKHFAGLSSNDYMGSFLEIKMCDDEQLNLLESEDESSYTRISRVIAAYKCVLNKAGFEHNNLKITFPGRADLNELSGRLIDPTKGIFLNEAYAWFEGVWENYTNEVFQKYKKDKGKEWADEDLKSVLKVLFRSNEGKKANSLKISGFKKLEPIRVFHTSTVGKSYENEVLNELRRGKIVILDLSQGDPAIQKINSERLCKWIFEDSMKMFTDNESEKHNFIQFYFEEAHNLFPKQTETDLTNIYNRLAKEGAKLKLGITYATQEVSSISNNILKNTQNWFISHLNNSDETKELRKYYDFSDFTDALVRYSNNSDKGFARIKTFSSSFVVSTQIDKFTDEEN